MNTSQAFDPSLHDSGSVAVTGGCSYHQPDGPNRAACTGDAVVSFQDHDGRWQSGCSSALEELVEHGDIEPLGQGA